MVGIIFISYAGKYAAKLFLRSKISSITFGIIPIVYYFFDYITTTYTNLLYSGNPVASEFMPFVCCIGRYCENELINAVLSFYNHKCSETGNISLHIDVKIPKDLSCNDMEFSFILSNGLENAYNAASKNDSKSTISVKILVDEMNHLLLTIKNPFKEKPSFVNNLPTTSAPGHGIGSQSIKYLTEKMGGRCQFTAENNLFVLRVII
ncbi:GHKL domain-containing protein [Clostridium isatidis]|uniref:GHKL domain-containing protein n=1 Tax=Clostridium isatidis TaxID=182773 RepID=UPI00182D8F4F|nr:sensor histidine kinase [Clostridiales bacterium]